MAENLLTYKRTHYCGELAESDIGSAVVVTGWVQRRRDLGSLIFIDLRDRTGIIQLALDEQSEQSLRDTAASLRSEYVVAASGEVRERQSKNPNLPTGSIEIYVTGIRILAQSDTPPFEITEGTRANEELRLKHRYLDLRRPDLMKNILFRHRVAKVTRDYFDENGFIEIETPVLIRSTPEGARDYLVPSRIHKGSFYALPQSPQLYKQLCMVAGFDRYFQLARCFRDEDLRADRQPEFTQIDLEMSFADENDIMEMAEGYMRRLFKETLDITIDTPIPRYTYRECMERFGSDKPDMRFGMEITDISSCVAGSGFAPFESALAAGGSVRGINAKGSAEKLTRKELDRLADYIKSCGASGLLWAKIGADGTSASFAKAVTPETLSAICAALGGEPGVHSARYTGNHEDSDLDRRKFLMKKLEGVEHREARFVSAICCVFPNGDVLRARGTCEGRIATYMKGENGFGYDAMFIYEGEERTMAEMTHEEKNKVSHRGRALREFAKVLKEYCDADK